MAQNSLSLPHLSRTDAHSNVRQQALLTLTKNQLYVPASGYSIVDAYFQHSDEMLLLRMAIAKKTRCQAERHSTFPQICSWWCCENAMAFCAHYSTLTWSRATSADPKTLEQWQIHYDDNEKTGKLRRIHMEFSYVSFGMNTNRHWFVRCLQGDIISASPWTGRIEETLQAWANGDSADGEETTKDSARWVDFLDGYYLIPWGRTNGSIPFLNRCTRVSDFVCLFDLFNYVHFIVVLNYVCKKLWTDLAQWTKPNTHWPDSKSKRTRYSKVAN